MDHQHITTANVGDDMGDMTDMTGMDMTTQGMDMGGDGGMTMMKMYFHFGISETVLFQGWVIHDIGSLVLSIVGVFLLALLYEALKCGRHWLSEYASSRHAARFTDSNGSGSDVPIKRENSYTSATPFTFWHITQTFLHIIQVLISYLLMMIFMTYNAWLCIAIIVGSGVGYFAFGWRSKVLVDVHADQCH